MSQNCVTFFTRKNCSLCVEGRKVLDQALRKVPLELTVIDIDENPEWFDEYKWDVPVLHLNDEFAFKHRFELQELVHSFQTGKVP